MFFASVGAPGGGGVDVFSFYLAEKLGKTIGELDDMPCSEYSGWKSFFRVKNQQEELQSLRARHG